MVDSAKISSFENYWKYLAYSQNFSFFSHLLPHPSTMLCHLDPFWTYWQNFWFFSRPLAPSVTDSFWMYWQNISFFLNSSRTLWLWSILDILAKVLIFPSAPCPCQALRHIHFGYIGNTFSFSPHHLPNPYHALWLCSILENFAKYFIFLSLPNPIPPPPNTLWFWSIWDIGKIFHFSRTSSLPTKLRDFDPFWTYWKSFSFFPHPFPSPIKLQKASLIHFGNIGKTFHFSLPPSPTPPYNALWLWFILDIFLIFLFFYKISTPPLRFMIFLFVYFLFVDYKFLTQCICNCSFVYCKDLESRQLLVTF